MAALHKIKDGELLAKVKRILGITGSYNDDAIELLIIDVKYYLLDAGVNETAVNSTAAIGCISRGVADLWNLGSGTVNLSAYFKERAAQMALCYPSGETIEYAGENNV